MLALLTVVPNEDLVVVELWRQRYAVAVRQVREVVPRATLTPLPGAPDGMLGILSLRGSLLPVVDLCHQLGLPSTEARTSQCILIVELARCAVGLLVDGAIGLVSAPRAGLATAREEPADLIREVSEIDGHVVSILDADAVVGSTITSYVVALACRPAALADIRDDRAGRERVRP